MKINCEDASAAAMSGVAAGRNPEISSCAHWEKFVEGAKHVVFGSILNVLLLALPLVIVAVSFNLGHVSISSKLLDFLNFTGVWTSQDTATLFTSLWFSPWIVAQVGELDCPCNLQVMILNLLCIEFGCQFWMCECGWVLLIAVVDFPLQFNRDSSTRWAPWICNRVSAHDPQICLLPSFDNLLELTNFAQL